MDLRALRDRIAPSLVLAATVAAAFALGGLWYGLQHDDIVTVLGALLFVPAAGLLAGIGLTSGADGRRRGGAV
jgi:hypothetical protein